MADHYHAIIPGTRSFATLYLGDVMTDQKDNNRFDRTDRALYSPAYEEYRKALKNAS